jgi:CubicO group peptidase (beta-lactamase class C family)
LIHPLSSELQKAVESWHYLNTGYMLLLLMIETVTGKSFSENTASFVVNKIRMTNTYVAENKDILNVLKNA